jgi:putative colanic acid biosynthesis glycosyltransferase WcaI
VRVLVITQHFAPEVTAGRFRLEAFVEGLLRGGHSVDVVCPVPNHPHGVVEAPYRGRPWFDDREGERLVRRVSLYVRPHKTTRSRLATYGSFAAAAVAAGAVLPRPDVLLVSSPPLTVGAAGAALAARFRRPMVFDVRDLWPESAASLGEVSNERLLAAARRLERNIYRRSSLILAANDAFSDHVRSVAPAGAEVVTVTNGTTAEWMAAGERDSPRSEAGLPEDRFVLAYAGNLGLAQSVDLAIESIGRLGPGFRLEIIGAGPRRDELERLGSRLPVDSVSFRGLLEPDRVARILRAADALLVAERQDKTVSAKLYDYSAIGRPIVAVCQGEMQRVVEREGIAMHVPLGDADALARALEMLRDDGALRDRLTANARSFAANHLRSDGADRLCGLLERVAAIGREDRSAVGSSRE